MDGRSAGAEPTVAGALMVDPTPKDEPRGPACVACGYDLAGLQGVALCPECGEPIRRATARGMGDLTVLSTTYLLRLSLGCHLLALGGLIALGTVAVMIVAMAVDAWPETLGLIAIAWIPASVAWCAGAWITTSPPISVTEAPLPGWPLARRPGLLWTVRLAQVAWVVWAIALVATLRSAAAVGGGNPGTVTALVLMVLDLVGIAGTAAVLLVIAGVVDAIGDTTLRDRMRAVAVAIGGGGLIAVVLGFFGALAGPGLIGGVLRVTSIVAGSLAMGGLLLTALLMAQLASTSRWAIAGARAQRERDRRLAERVQRAPTEFPPPPVEPASDPVARAEASRRARDLTRPTDVTPSRVRPRVVDRPDGGADPYGVEE